MFHLMLHQTPDTWRKAHTECQWQNSPELNLVQLDMNALPRYHESEPPSQARKGAKMSQI